MDQSAAPAAAPTRYRWFILAIICLGQMITWMDRANIGVVLPALRAEFHISNLAAGSIAGIYFLGYAVLQIPAGLLISRFGVRGFIAAAMIAFSAVTGLIGTASSAFMVKVYRLLLGITEAPVPVSTNGTIRNWFPATERGIAIGLLTACSSLAIVLTAPTAVWIMTHYGWRSVFLVFSVPGIVMALVWYLLIRRTPAESPHCNAQERAYIGVGSVGGRHAFDPTKRIQGSFGWLDRLMRLRPCPTIETNARVFSSRNIIGIALIYLCMHGINYGLMTWIPSYLVTVKHFTAMKMGWTSSAPWLGGFFGTLVGGALSDKLLLGRRKPMILFSALTTILMMLAVIHAPNEPTVLALILFLTGFFLYLAWPSMFAYPMGFTNAKTFPVAVSIMITGGNLGSFLAPTACGYVLDLTHSYDMIFLFLGACALVSLLIATLLEEAA